MINIYWLLGFIIVSFSAGAYTDHKFHLANQVTAALEQVSKAQSGEVKLIKKDEELQKEFDKNADPCLSDRPHIH